MSPVAILKPPKSKKQTLKESEKKWGQVAIANGFTVFPNALLSQQDTLKLTCVDVVLILQIHKHWWYADKKPFPSQGQLAKTMGVDLSTVKRRLAAMRDQKLISWKGQKNKQGGQAANVYDLSGLIKRVEEEATKELAEKEKKKAAVAKKPTGKRKKTKLTLVPKL